MREAARVLRPSGMLIITSWYLWRPHYLRRLITELIKSILFLSPLDAGDMMHTFGKDKHPRYLHAFTHHELLRLVRRNRFEIIGSEIVSRQPAQAGTIGSGEQNILIVARKR